MGLLVVAFRTHNWAAVVWFEVSGVVLLMVATLHLCAACGSGRIQRNGSAAGHAKYQCKACGHQVRFVPAAVARAVRYAQVDQLLVPNATPGAASCA